MLDRKILRIIFRHFIPWIIAIFVLSMGFGLYFSLVQSPSDYVQGSIARIMYIHVPAAWIALGAYFMMAVLSLAVLVWGNVMAGILSRAIAPIGLVFTIICLVTGSIWGRGTWGAWWVWDARLTSMLFLAFLYIGYLSLHNFLKGGARAEKSAAVFAIFSSINIPIIKFSVNIWSTLHQPASIFRKGGIAIDSSMLVPLILMFIAFTSFFILFAIIRAQTLINMRKLAVKQRSMIF